MDWVHYNPPRDGRAPAGWDGSPVEFYSTIMGKWRPTFKPMWLEGQTYRYRPRVSAEPAPAVVVPPKTIARQMWEAEVELFTSLPDDDAVRGDYPMFDGLMAYFPNALAEVSKVSKIGNDQHNPGQPMHWARNKSLDHENKIMRHLADVGTKDGRGVRHSARLAWRALALLQEELERDEGLPPSRASRDRTF